MSDTLIICEICQVQEAHHAGSNHEFKRGIAPGDETPARGLQFRDRHINPDAGLYITLEDTLVVVIATSVAGIEVDIGVRLALPDGQIIPMNFPLFPAAARASNIFRLQLAEGILLSVAASTPTTGVRKGACFANLSLGRGNAVNPIDLYDLTEGYIITGNDIGWPWPDSVTSVDGSGLVRAVQVTGTAAGADWVQSVAVGARWMIQSIVATLTPSAAVANRIVHFEITDAAAHILYNVPVNTPIVASTPASVCGVLGVPAYNNDAVLVFPLPAGVHLLQGWNFGTVTTGLQAADQWSNVWLNLIEWLEF